MQTDPLTGRPASEIRSEKRLESDQRMAESAYSLKTELSQGEGKGHLIDLLSDYQQIVDSLSTQSTPDERLASVSKLEYIRNRLQAWGVKLALGQAAAERLRRLTVETGLKS